MRIVSALSADFFVQAGRILKRVQRSRQGVFIHRRYYGINAGWLNGREETIENVDNNEKRRQRRWQPWRWISPRDVTIISSPTSRIRSSARMRTTSTIILILGCSCSPHPCFFFVIAFIHPRSLFTSTIFPSLLNVLPSFEISYVCTM